MKAKLLMHEKVTDEYGNTIEIRAWQIPLSKEKPHGFKYRSYILLMAKE